MAKPRTNRERQMAGRIERPDEKEEITVSEKLQMNVQWQRVKQDALEGYKTLREEMEGLFNRALMGAEAVKAKKNLGKLEASLNQKYREIGEKLYHHVLAGERRLNEKGFIEKEFSEVFKEIGRIQDEKQRIVEEIKEGPSSQDP
jgi:hypothetical protein